MFSFIISLAQARTTIKWISLLKRGHCTGKISMIVCFLSYVLLFPFIRVGVCVIC